MDDIVVNSGRSRITDGSYMQLIEHQSEILCFVIAILNLNPSAYTIIHMVFAMTALTHPYIFII
jgi:hypothetical protein